MQNWLLTRYTIIPAGRFAAQTLCLVLRSAGSWQKLISQRSEPWSFSVPHLFPCLPSLLISPIELSVPELYWLYSVWAVIAETTYSPWGPFAVCLSLSAFYPSLLLLPHFLLSFCVYAALCLSSLLFPPRPYSFCGAKPSLFSYLFLLKCSWFTVLLIPVVQKVIWL